MDKSSTLSFPIEYIIMQIKNILVTGSNGQLGSEIQNLSKNYNYNFFFTGVAELDITKENLVDLFVKENNINCIINCAAYTAVDKAEDDIKSAYLINRDASAILGRVATKHNACVIHVSTDYVFDGKGTRPYVETDTVNPQSVYGSSKLEGENLLQKVCPNSIIIRTSWLYSTYGNNFVKTMIRLGKEKESLSVVADQKGSPTYAGDLAKAILDIINFTNNIGMQAGVYHFANEGETTWYDFTRKIHELAGIKTCKLSPTDTAGYPTRAQRPAYSVLSKDKIKSTFNITIPQWEESLELCIKKLSE